MKFMPEKIKISLIIPVYNTENYLQQCMESILNQTFREFEIIALDNGSVDNSYNILLEYKKNHPNITVLQDTTGKQGYLRNTGVRLARGEYVSFVDSDDFLDENFLETLYKKAIELDLDIISSNFYYFYSEDEKYEYSFFDKVHLPEKYSYLPNNVPFGKVLKLGDFKESLLLPTFNCGSLYRKSFLKEKGVFYAENLVMGEDQVFKWKARVSALSFLFIDKPLYYYRQTNISSTTKQVDSTRLQIFKVFDIIREFLAENERFYELKELFYKDLWNNYFFNYFSLSGDLQKEFFNEMKRRILSENLFDNSDFKADFEYFNKLDKERLYAIKTLDYEHFTPSGYRH